MSSILLVDDDPDILSVLETTFETAGHDIVVTTDPLSIEGLLEQSVFDAVILDVMMPLRSGWEVLESLRQDPTTHALPVVLLSAVGDPSNRVRGIRLGADDFLSKPFDPEEVLVRVEGLLARRGTGTLQGSLARMALAEVLQTLQQTHASGVLEVVSPGGRGEILLENGAIWGAQFGRWLGADAVTALLPLRQGSFSLIDQTGTMPRLPRPISVQSLLLDVAWIEDELRRREDHQARGGEPLSRIGPLAAPPKDMPTIPIDWAASTVESRQGITLEQLIEDAPTPAPRVRLAVAWLVEHGVLARQQGTTFTGRGNVERRILATSRPVRNVAGAAATTPITRPVPVVAPTAQMPTVPTRAAVAPPAKDASGSWAALADDDLVDLLAEFASESRRKGFREPAVLALLIHPRAWESIPNWLVTLARRNQMGARAVSVRVEPPQGGEALDLVFRSLAGHADDPQLAEFAGFVLWLGDEPWSSVGSALETALRHFHPQALRMAIAAESAPALPGAWKLSKKAPENLSHLLEILLSPVF